MSWDDYEAGCLNTYGGGYREGPEILAFQHGMQTVFNLLRAEFPPADLCKATTARLAALERERDEARGLLKMAYRWIDRETPPEVHQKLRAALAAGVGT